MAFVERGWRSFLRTGDPDPTVWRGRMAGQLMTYEACKDPRAWCLSAHDRRQHLIDIMRRGPDDLDGTLALPTEAVVRREPPIQRKRPEIKPPPTPAAAPPPPKTPPQEAEQPQDAHVAFAEEEKPTVAEAPTPTEVTESEETAEAPEPPGKTAKERAGDFCMSLSGLANELDGMLRSKSVCQMVPRLYEICKELSDLATECASLQSQMSRRTTEAESLVEAARAATDTDLMEEFVEDYDSFDTMRFITDIAQVRMLEDKLNDMRLEGMEDDADEADETWQLRNIVAELENRLDYSKDEVGVPVRRAEDFSQTDYASQGSEGGRSYESSEASSREFLTPEQRECDELRATIENLQRRIEILESEKHDIRGRDTYEDREAANLRDQLHSLTAERDNLVNQLNQAKMEAEALKQENAGLLQETEAIRQEMAQLQGEHLAALDYIKSLEEATAECTMMKEENKRMEDKLQQTTREQGKLHHEVHKLQCIIRDVEDDRKRTLNQLERLSYAAEWAKVLQMQMQMQKVL